MQKLKAILFSTICISLFLLSGCKSLPESKSIPVNPFEVMDSQGFIYFSVPKNCDPELYNKLMENSGVSNPNQITKNIDKVFFNLSQSKYGNFLEIQGVIQGNIPVSFVEKKLNESWEQETFQYENKNYKIFHNNGFELSIPSSKMALFGRDNSSMLKNYHDCFYQTAEREVILDYELISFLTESDREIRIVCSDIPFMLNTLLNDSRLRLKAECLKASIFPDLVNKNYYIMDVTLTFQNELFLKAGKAILSMVLDERAVKMEVDGKNLIIEGFPIKKETLYSLKLF